MPVNVSVKTHGDLARLGKFLRETGEKERVKAVFRGINAETEPIKPLLQQSARDTLPKGGGLNEDVAAAEIVTRTRLWGKNVGVRVTAAQTKRRSAALRRRNYMRRHGVKSTRGKKARAALAASSGGPMDLQSIDRGVVYHPKWGRAPLVRQSVRPGWFRTPLRTIAAQRVRRAVVTAVQEYLKQAAAAAGGPRRAA